MALKKKTCTVESEKYCSTCRMYSTLTYLIAVLPVRLPLPPVVVPVSTSHHCAHILDVAARSLSCTLTASTRADNNICTYFFFQPLPPLCLYACVFPHKDMRAVCVPATLAPPPKPLRGFACWVELCSVKQQRAHLTHFHNLFFSFFFPSCPARTSGGGFGQGGVIDSGAPHLKHSSVHAIRFPATNATGETNRCLFFFQSSLERGFPFWEESRSSGLESKFGLNILNATLG